MWTDYFSLLHFEMHFACSCTLLSIHVGILPVYVFSGKFSLCRKKINMSFLTLREMPTLILQKFQNPILLGL